jgi:hypothetical protein
MKFGAVGQDDNKSVFYRIACDCTSPECDLTLELEKDPDGDFIYLNLYKKLRANAYWGYSTDWEPFEWLRVLMNKIRMCCHIIFNGYIEVSEGFVIRGEDQINAFEEALFEGLEYLQTKEDERSEKSDSGE